MRISDWSSDVCSSDLSTNETMTVAAARRLQNNAVCFVGIGLPAKAANLARLTSSPDVVLIYESGPIGAKPSVLPLSIGDGELAETADTVVPTGEIFRYWRSEEHTSELQSLMRISYAVFCLKKQNTETTLYKSSDYCHNHSYYV